MLEYLDNLIKWRLSKYTGERQTIREKYQYQDEDFEAWQLVEYIDVLINQVELNTAVLNKLVEKCGFHKMAGYTSRLNPETVTKKRNYDKNPISDDDLLWQLETHIIPVDKMEDYIYFYDTENLKKTKD